MGTAFWGFLWPHQLWGQGLKYLNMTHQCKILDSNESNNFRRHHLSFTLFYSNDQSHLDRRLKARACDGGPVF